MIGLIRRSMAAGSGHLRVCSASVCKSKLTLMCPFIITFPSQARTEITIRVACTIRCGLKRVYLEREVLGLKSEKDHVKKQVIFSATDKSRTTI